MTKYNYSVYYSRFHSETEEHTHKMVAWTMKLISPHVPADRSQPILDIGCGYGFAIRALQKLGFKNIIGIEVSAEQAQQARKTGCEIIVVENTAHWLQENKQRFGFALMLDVLEHIPVEDQIDFASSVQGALRPDGKLLLTVPNANAILAARWRYQDYTHHASFTEHSLHFVLKSAGFETIETATDKGLGRIPKRLWQAESWKALRLWIIRWCWLQVFKAEMPWERIEDISFELNLKAVASNT